MKPHICIIILNWNGWKDTIECLESLYQITYPNYTVILVDNGSEDDSPGQIRSYCDGKIKVESPFFDYNPKNKPIKIFEYSHEEVAKGNSKIDEMNSIPSNQRIVFIKNEKNYGFAEGNNIGMRFALSKCSPEYLLLLNNDTVVDTFFLEELVEVSRIDKMVGFVGPKIYYYTFEGRTDIISHAGGTLDYWRGAADHIGDKKIDTGEYNEITKVSYLSGACVLVTRSVIDRIGLLNSEYFLYWEDADWCVRGTRSGYTCLYAPKARIWHKIGGSSVSVTTEYYSTRNRFFFMRDNATSIQLFIFFIYFFFYKLWVLFISRLILHKDMTLFFTLLKGIFDGMKLNRYQGKEIHNRVERSTPSPYFK
jgi:hypothetical protein